MIEITPELIKLVADEMDMASDEIDNYLDMETGETVMIIGEEYADEIEDQPSKEEVEADTDRYRLIPVVSSTEGWDLMADFADNVADRKYHKLFENALNRKGAFRNFRAVLESVDLLQEWYDFKNQKLLERAETWLKEQLED